MKKVLLILVLLILVSLVSAAPIINIEPSLPFPHEALTCHANQPAPAYEYEWYINGDLKAIQGSDEDSMTYLPDTRELDTVTCKVYIWRGEDDPFIIAGEDTVTVGEFACNNGFDDDQDGFTDLDDKGCGNSRMRNSELTPEQYLTLFCEESHPKNLFCLELGYNHIRNLCEEIPDADACVYLQDDFDDYCDNFPGSDICLGARGPIVPYCVGIMEEGMMTDLCTFIFQSMIQCQVGNANLCFDLSDMDKTLICEQEENAFEFCPEGIQNPCVGMICPEGLVCVDGDCLDPDNRGDDFGFIPAGQLGGHCDEIACAEGVCHPETFICVDEFQAGELGGPCQGIYCDGILCVEVDSCNNGLICENDACIEEPVDDPDEEEEEEEEEEECEEDDTRTRRCSNGQRIRQICIDNEWEGRCPKEIIVPGDEHGQPDRQGDSQDTVSPKDKYDKKGYNPSTTDYSYIPVVVILLLLAIILAKVVHMVYSKPKSFGAHKTKSKTKRKKAKSKKR